MEKLIESLGDGNSHHLN